MAEEDRETIFDLISKAIQKARRGEELTEAEKILAAMFVGLFVLSAVPAALSAASFALKAYEMWKKEKERKKG